MTDLQDGYNKAVEDWKKLEKEGEKEVLETLQQDMLGADGHISPQYIAGYHAGLDVMGRGGE